MSSRTRSDLLIAVALVVLASREARADDAALDAQRERFKVGMEKYAAGRYADAIVVWEAIYREIGETTGYRLAFNLGRAYDKFGDSTRAAEHYEVFVRQVARRREGDDALGPEIDKWESEAKERLAELAASKARIRVVAGDRPTAVRIDAGEPRLAGFIAYVAPGRHVVTFGSGEEAQVREVTVEQGALVELAPPPPPAPRAEQPASPPPAAPAALLSPLPARWETRTQRPFSPAFLWVAGGAAALSTLVPIVTHANALSIKDDYDAANERLDPSASGLASDYESARSAAYATIAIPIALAAATAGLATWYFVGTKETRVRLGAGGVGAAF